MNMASSVMHNVYIKEYDDMARNYFLDGTDQVQESLKFRHARNSMLAGNYLGGFHRCVLV